VVDEQHGRPLDQAVDAANSDVVAEKHLDLPPTPVERVVLLASLARTGSSLLAAQLDSTRCVGVPREYLNADALSQTGSAWGLPRQSLRGHLGQVRRRMRGDDDWRKPVTFSDRSFGPYLQFLAARRTTSNGVFSMKVNWGDWEQGFLLTGQSLDLWNAPITWVRLFRTDEVAQAISFSRARQSGQWSSSYKTKITPTYDESHIIDSIRHIERNRVAWDHYFVSIGVEPYVVVYESLLESTTEIVRALLDWLGFPDAQPAPPSTRRQSGTESAEWQERFLKNHPEYLDRTGHT